MKTKTAPQQKGLWARLAQFGLGLLIIVGAIWALTQPATAFPTFLTILGLMLLLRGVAGIIAFYRLKHSPVLKDKLNLGLGVLLLVLGGLMLVVPNLLAPALQWVAAAAFVLTALRGLLAFRALRAKNPGMSTLSLVLNLVMLACGILLVFNPLPAVFTLPLLIAVALACIGIDLIVDVLAHKLK